MKKLIVYMLATLIIASISMAAVGDVVHILDYVNGTLPKDAKQNHCSIGVAFDGTSLYYNICNDQNMYKINPITGALQATKDVGVGDPNAMAYDASRNGIWFGMQDCVTINSVRNMPIYFWDLDDDSVTLMFNIPETQINPATNQDFLSFCFTDGLAFNANGDGASDDEIWFSDDVNKNVGVWRPDGTFVAGYDATTIDSSLSANSGLAIGGSNLYLGNNGGEDVFRAQISTFTLVDQFVSGDGRQEDMECDPNTFDVEVMWVRTTPQSGLNPDRITAYEIEPNTCGLGGEDPVIPEFGTIGAGLALLGAAVFALKKRRR